MARASSQKENPAGRSHGHLAKGCDNPVAIGTQITRFSVVLARCTPHFEGLLTKTYQLVG